MKKLFLFLPFSYGFTTRAKGIIGKMSFIGLIIIPNAILSYFASGEHISVISFLLAFSALYATYEMGYIYNDVLTVNHENNPTKWLPETLTEYVNEMYELMISARAFFIMITVLLIYNIDCKRNIIEFVCLLICLHMFYAFHNYFRDARNIITVFLLQIIKYGGLVILFGKADKILIYLLCGTIGIGMIRTYEYAREKSFLNLKPIFKNLDYRRVIYYIVLLLVAVLFYFNYQEKGVVVFAGYLLLFRIISLGLSNISVVKNRRNHK